MKQEQCYGVVIVFKENENKFLLLQHKDKEGSWSFPKGHHEGVETPKETALREVLEETGILDVELVDAPLLHEEYYLENKTILKNNDYFIGFVKDQNVTIQNSEIHIYKWLSYEDALDTLQYIERKEVLKKVKEYLK